MKKIVGIIGILIVLAAILYAAKFYEFYAQIYTPKSNGKTNPEAPPKTDYNVLLLGYGGAGHEGAYLTDTIIVLHVDTAKNKAVLISLSRDIWVKLPTKSGTDFHRKINSVYQMDLFPDNYPDVAHSRTDETDLIKKTISMATGLTIDNFVAIDFTGFKKSIDVVGGVDVQVEKTFDDYKYPLEGKEKDLCENQLIEKDLTEEEAKQFNINKGTHTVLTDKDNKILAVSPDNEKEIAFTEEQTATFFPCRYEQLHFDAGLTNMDGAMALKYVRSRHGTQDGGDFGRAARQQLLLEAVRDKVLSIGFIPKVIPLLDELKDEINTDVSPADAEKFLGEVGDVNKYTLTHIVPSTENYLMFSRSDDGQSIIIPRTGLDNWKEIQKIIKNTILGITPTPTSSKKLQK